MIGAESRTALPRCQTRGAAVARLHPARRAPGADLLGVLAIVAGGVVVDDAVRGLAGLPALRGDVIGGLYEVLVRAVQLQQQVGDLSVPGVPREARVPGVDVVLARD